MHAYVCAYARACMCMCMCVQRKGGERKKVDNCVVDSRINWPEDKKCCAHQIFFLVGGVMINC